MSSTISQIGQAGFSLAYEISPIILVNGIASNIPGSMLPLAALTTAFSATNAVLSGSLSAATDNPFATFRVVPGGDLIKNDLGKYPFANQQVAGNAIIADSLHISMLMIAPATGPGSYLLKLAQFTALQGLLSQHTSQGGLFHVLTPAFIYTYSVLLNMRDVSPAPSMGGPKQIQSMWQLDFEKPLITLASAATVLNTLMSKMQSGLPTDGATSGATAGTVSGALTPTGT